MSLTKGLKFFLVMHTFCSPMCRGSAWVHVRVGELACTREDLFNICLIRKMACGLLKDNVVQWEAIAEHVVYSILNSSSSPSKRTNGWTSSGARNLKAKYCRASVPKMAREPKRRDHNISVSLAENNERAEDRKRERGENGSDCSTKRKEFPEDQSGSRTRDLRLTVRGAIMHGHYTMGRWVYQRSEIHESHSFNELMRHV